MIVSLLCAFTLGFTATAVYLSWRASERVRRVHERLDALDERERRHVR